MNLKTIMMTLAAAGLASAAIAADTNFAPANMSGNGPAAEVKDRPVVQRAEPKDKEPGFWDREGKRSGLAGTGEGFGTSVKKLWHVPDWFQKQQDEYKARHPETDR